MTNPAILEEDLRSITARLGASWQALRGARIFFTGATGFIGRWMLEALCRADRLHGLDLSVTLLTRDPERFAASHRDLSAYPAFTTVRGDVLSLEPDGTGYTHVIHGATDASADLNENNPLRMFDTIVAGTRNTLDFARAARARRYFFMSSGAVYGAQPWSIEQVAEDFMGGPDIAAHRSAYGEGKRAAELLCTIYGKQFGMDIVTARIFALLGPMLSLDIHFAAGNFIRDAMAGRKIVVASDGRAERSYLYAADLTEWLWAIVLRAQPGAIYNVGSEDAVSIADLARRTSELLGGQGYEILGKPDQGWNPGRYVPSTEKIRRELNLTATVGLDEAIRRTAAWNGWNS
jgi:UDP-glucuronate decarboxylase